MEFLEKDYKDTKAYYQFLSELRIQPEILSDDDLYDYSNQLIDNREYLNYLDKECCRGIRNSKIMIILNSVLAVGFFTLGLFTSFSIALTIIPILTVLISISNYNFATRQQTRVEEDKDRLENKILDVQEEDLKRYNLRKIEKLKTRQNHLDNSIFREEYREEQNPSKTFDNDKTM